jgi:hypothetical protein
VGLALFPVLQMKAQHAWIEGVMFLAERNHLIHCLFVQRVFLSTLHHPTGTKAHGLLTRWQTGIIKSDRKGFSRHKKGDWCA